MTPEQVATAIREGQPDVLAAVETCAAHVAAGWPDDSATDRAAVVEPLQTCLERTGTLERLPEILAHGTSLLDESLPAPATPAPPYVTVTSRGPVLRATLSDDRLVIAIEVFELDRQGTDHVYRPLETAELTVECIPRS